MDPNDTKSNFRTVNQSLGTPVGVGPIPGTQFIYWAVIFFGSWTLFQYLRLTSLQSFCLAIWLVFAWTILTGTMPWKFLSGFIKVPQWGSRYALYEPLLPLDRTQSDRVLKNK